MQKSEKLQFKNWKLLLIFVFLILFVIGGFIYFIYPRKTSNSQVADQTQVILQHIATVIELPDENPIVATVSDQNKLRNKEFFAKSDIGDILLIYPSAKKAFLYRPSIKKIIGFGPLFVSVPSSSPSPAFATITVAIYNGTSVSGLAASMGEKLTEIFSNINVVKRVDAKNAHTRTSIVDLTGNNEKIVEELAIFFEAEIESMPENELKPNTDILVILGK